MKPLFEQICGWLDGRGWDYQPESEQQRLILQVEGLTVVVEVSENGEFVKIFLPQLLTLGDDHPHYEAALETLLHLGWQYKLARWQRDPDDGEVRLRADLPLEDSQLTQKQFWRTLEGTLQIAQQGREQLRGVLETGEDSPERTALFEALLQAEMKGGAEAVYQELDQRGGRLDPQLPDAAKTFLQQDHILGNKEIEAAVVGLIENIAISLLEYPRGRREQNVAIAILLYGLVLEARPPERLPDKWAQTQNNLGNAYCDLPTGDRAAHLQQAINCYNNALTVWNPDTAPLDWAMTQNNLGSAYSDLPTGDRAANLQQAIKCYEDALTVWKPDTAPLEWATTQNNLGSAYSDLPTGDRAANLQQAIKCYENALTVWKPDTAPLDWAMTQNNLGNAYLYLPTGDRAANLQRAINCYNNALTVWNPDTAPLQWATTQNNLGSAYSDLPTGDRAANLQQAIKCYEDALTVRKPDTAPLDWAGTQNNLGNAYLYLPTGDRAAHLQQAIQCYNNALTVRNPDTAPLDWAMTQNNLGLAYSDLPTGDRAANLQQAIKCYNNALTVWKPDTAPLDWAMTQNNLGSAYSDLPTGDRAAHLQQAIKCYNNALTVWKPDTAPLDWAGTQNNLGLAYLYLPTGDRAANLQRAIDCYNKALTVRKPDTAPLEWAGTQNNLGSAYSDLPTGDRAAHLQQAINCYNKARTVRKPDTAPLQWATTQNNLGNAYSDLPTGDRAANLQQAIKCYEDALTVWKPDTAPLQWATTQNNLGNAYSDLPTGDRAANLQQAIKCYENALTVWKPDTAPLQWATTQNNLGLAYSDLPTGDRAAHLQRAIKCYEDALTVRKPDTAPLDCLQTARNWANLEFNQGHWQQALNQYQTAIAAIEQSRRGALSESRRQQIIQESIYVYENAIQAAINLDDIPTALEIVERVRAKRLVDLMATADLYADGNIPPQVQEWLQQLDRLDDQIAQKRQEFQDDSGETKPDGLKTRQLRAATAVSADIAEIERQKQDILDQIGGVDEVVAKLRQVQPPKLSDFQPLLSKKTAILNFYTTDDDTHIFILRPGESQPHCFTCKGQGLETLQMWLIKTWMKPYLSDKTQWREQMPDTLAEIAHRLQLNRLITEHLQDMEELVIVPHLFLHQIPFVALPINLSSPTGRGAGGEGYLGDKFLLRYAPSLQVLGFCHHRGPVSMSDYGTAENATDDLPFSGFEGSKVAELFKIDPQRRLIGAAATRQNYRQLLAQVNRLVSTHHAQSRFDNSQESGLKLSDGTISVSQLFSPGWRFPKLDEVFLSCCETGLFSPSSAIDEPVALSTGFLCAGARGLIASQWSIYDCSAALLSILYHEQRQGGLNRVRALQAAQQKMRQMTGAEFKKQYKEPVENHLKAEENRLANHVNHEPLLMGVSDAQRAVKMYANDKGCPFEHPVHWGALGCYGLG